MLERRVGKGNRFRALSTEVYRATEPERVFETLKSLDR